MPRVAIAFAPMKERKIMRGLRQGLTKQERYCLPTSAARRSLEAIGGIAAFHYGRTLALAIPAALECQQIPSCEALKPG
jgi:hypothetical protein